MSQCNDILHHMQTQGGLTTLDALDLYGCFRLASRINDLRNDGHDIVTIMEETNNGKKIARYFLKRSKHD